MIIVWTYSTFEANRIPYVGLGLVENSIASVAAPVASPLRLLALMGVGMSFAVLFFKAHGRARIAR